MNVKQTTMQAKHPLPPEHTSPALLIVQMLNSAMNVESPKQMLTVDTATLVVPFTCIVTGNFPLLQFSLSKPEYSQYDIDLTIVLTNIRLFLNIRLCIYDTPIIKI